LSDVFGSAYSMVMPRILIPINQLVKPLLKFNPLKYRLFLIQPSVCFWYS